MNDIYTNHRDKAKGTPFYQTGPMLCRCGQTPFIVGDSFWAGIDKTTATAICQNTKCGAYGLMFEIELPRLEGKVVHNAP